MNAALKATTAITAFIPPRDFVMNPPRAHDRITFNTSDDGVLAGYVSIIRQHLGNGQRFAWVEVENELAGLFRGVPLADIITCDDSGLGRRAVRNSTSIRPLYLADFSARAVVFA